MLCRLPAGTRVDKCKGTLIFSPNLAKSKKYADYAKKAVTVSHRDLWTGAWLVNLVEDPSVVFGVQKEQLKVSVDKDLEDYL